MLTLGSRQSGNILHANDSRFYCCWPVPNSSVASAPASLPLTSVSRQPKRVASVCAMYKPMPVPPSRLRRSEEPTSELQSLMRISYAVFCLKKKRQHTKHKIAQRHHTRHDPRTTTHRASL